jgi:lipopolysaccharide export system permease protein
MNDLIGKGLEFAVLAEFFLYAGFSIIPLALPLAILLASIMTFGNLGEKFELIAMKASGISLFRIMLSLIILISCICVGAFFFSNNVLPITQKRMTALLYSIKNTSPEVEIPTGEFYSGIEGYNIYVRDKENDGKLLRDVMIYDFSKGFNNANVTSADSARIQMSGDKMYLIIKLYSGESFENLKRSDGYNSNNKSIPYRRESFIDKEFLIDFDANFKIDEEGLNRNQHLSRNIVQLQEVIDSLHHRSDSIINVMSNSFLKSHFFGRNTNYGYSLIESTPKAIAAAEKNPLSKGFTEEEKNRALEYAVNQAKYTQTEIENNSMFIEATNSEEIKNRIEWHRKFTLSFACLIFFFIGAPLGAIIRKGGLGISITISVLMFIVYYIIDQMGYKMAREEIWTVWKGIWLSSFCLLPIGLFFTYKAATDSPIFNSDTYWKLWRKLKLSFRKKKI